MYRSGFEASIADQLRQAGVHFAFEPDKLTYYKRVTMGECKGCGNKDVYQKKVYIPDFKIGPKLYIEAKGKFVASDRRKILLVREYNPEIEVRFVFQRNNLLGFKHGGRYSDWCKNHGFLYVMGEYSDEWI